MTPPPQMITVARAEALFISSVPTGATLTGTEVHAAVAAAVRAHGGVRQCAAEMAAAFGERPDVAVRRMRWALAIVAGAGAVTA
jgi:hypothetical protein